MKPEEYDDNDLLFSWSDQGGETTECKLCGADDYGQPLVHKPWCGNMADIVTFLRGKE